MTNSGSGYNYATVSVVGDGINATANVVLAPNGGHAYSPADELFAYYIMFSVDLEYDETGIFFNE